MPSMSTPEPDLQPGSMKHHDQRWEYSLYDALIGAHQETLDLATHIHQEFTKLDTP